MGHIDLNGLVLAADDARENDRYLDVLTDKIGRIKVVAKGVNKKFGGMCPSCQPFSYSKMTLFENRGRYQLDCSELIMNFAGKAADIERLALYSYFAEAASAVSYEGTDSAEALRLCLSAFDAAAKGKNDMRIIKAAFELKLMCVCGYMPEVSKCAVCGAADANAFFDVKRGLAYCTECRGAASDGACIQLTHGALDAVKYTLREDVRRIFGFGLGEDSIRTFSAAAQAYLLARTEKRLKTLEFFNNLQSIENYAAQMCAAKNA